MINAIHRVRSWLALEKEVSSLLYKGQMTEHANDVEELLKQLQHAEASLKTASIRLEILTGRMRGCHEETGKHELLDEAEMFCEEARKYFSEKSTK